MRVSFLLFTILCVVTSHARAYQSMQVHCVDTAGEPVWIRAYHQGPDGDGGNRHQLYRERWTDGLMLDYVDIVDLDWFTQRLIERVQLSPFYQPWMLQGIEANKGIETDA